MYKRIINLTFLPVFKSANSLSKALFLPLLFIILISEIIKAYGTEAFIIIPLMIIVFLLNINIAIITHRILLLGENSINKWGSLNFGKRELSFLFTSIFIGIIIGVVLIIGVVIGAIPFLPENQDLTTILSIGIAGIVAAIFFSRFSLALPAIAIDKGITINEAWAYTKKYKLLTLFTIVIFPAIFTAIVGLVYEIAIAFLIKVFSPNFSILYPILDVFITVFVVSALSATYRVIKEDHPEYFEKKVFTKNEIIINNNKEEIIVDNKELQINFEILKNELINQYKEIGFNKIVVDKEDSWMAKNPENENAYIALTQKENEYKIEAFNVKKADLNSLI